MLIDIGDVELHVETFGEGFPVFFVAGLGGRGAFWSKQIAPFSKHFQVILHDHRGTGSSTPGEKLTGVEQMADDLLRLMDKLRIEQAHLVGHSTGGAIGQYIALKAPQRLGRLVLSCSWPGPDAYFTLLFETRRRILTDVGPEAYITTGNFLGTPSSFLQPQLAAADGWLHERVAAFPGVDVELSRIDAVMAHNLRDRLPCIKHQTLCIGAEDDQITPPGFSREMAGLIDGAELQLLKRGGHFCPISATEEYNPIVLDFLTR